MQQLDIVHNIIMTTISSLKHHKMTKRAREAADDATRRVHASNYSLGDGIRETGGMHHMCDVPNIPFLEIPMLQTSDVMFPPLHIDPSSSYACAFSMLHAESLWGGACTYSSGPCCISSPPTAVYIEILHGIYHRHHDDAPQTHSSSAHTAC